MEVDPKYFIVSRISREQASHDRYEPFYACQYTAFKEGCDLNDDKVAPFLYADKKNYEAASIFVQEKYDKYIPILAERLNAIHGVSFSNDFWARTFSLGLLRQITFAYQMFDKCETFFQRSRHTCRVLDEFCYKTNYTYADERGFLQSTHRGQEQLFSIYINTFYPDCYDSFQYDSDETVVENIVSKNAKPGMLWRLFRRGVFRAIKLRLARKIFGKSDRVRVAILGAYFTRLSRENLFLESKGRVNEISVSSCVKSEPPLDWKARDFIGSHGAEMDRFDKYFFSVLRFGLPLMYLEGFEEQTNKCDALLGKYPELECIVSEAWLGSDKINLFRALAYEKREIRTLYNEHNCFFHPFIGDVVDLESRLVDNYLTLGWDPGSSDRFERSASLFDFSIAVPSHKKYDILHVSYPAIARIPTFVSNYSNGEFGAIEHLRFVSEYLSLLPVDLLRKTSYRGYPMDYSIDILRYDKEKYLDDFLRHVQIVSSKKHSGETCKQQMASSRIVVIDFLSTAYLESLMMNIPTIGFFNPDVMFLDDEHSDFYDLLIEAKILHTNPESAAAHLNHIHNDPSLWWEDAFTQDKKNKWLSRNFGDPQTLYAYLISLSDGEITVDLSAPQWSS